MEKTKPEAGVVIPFFQREHGILRRCVQSIFSQDFKGNIIIIIVDDSSPLKPELDLKELQVPENIELHVIHQKNSGPGVARNTGIDFLMGRNPAYIAFLDSDDQWSSSHLSNAIAAFRNQADVYTSDWVLRNGENTGFAIRKINTKDLAFNGGLAFGGFLKRDLLEQEIANSCVKLSALVLTSNILDKTRFHRKLRYASEDRLFVVELAVKKPKVFFSLEQEVIAGSGVNIYESIKYGSLELFNTLKDKLAGRILIMSNLSNENHEIKELIRKDINDIKNDINMNFLSCLRQRKFKSIVNYLCFTLEHPSILVTLPTSIIHALQKTRK